MTTNTARSRFLTDFELTATRSTITENFKHSARILGYGPGTFSIYLVEGNKLNEKRIGQYIADSVMFVPAPSPLVGDERQSASCGKP